VGGARRRLVRIALAAIAAGCLCAGLISLFLTGFSRSPALRALQVVAVLGAGALVIGGAVVLALVRLGGWKEPESEREFEALVQRAERLAASGAWLPDAGEPGIRSPDPRAGAAARRREEFEALVRAAIDELPLEFHRALEHVAIVISDEGARRRRGAPRGVYGLYEGDTVARDFFHERIVIFRDTLLRDFGHDPAQLQAQVARTLRHELAHHLGWDENGVRGLGL
jgi:predicted Zn-dependent protease with MMP-like domain